MTIFVWLAVGWTLLSFFISPLLGGLIAAGTKPARIIEEAPKRDPLEVQAVQLQELPRRSPLIIVPEPDRPRWTRSSMAGPGHTPRSSR